MCALAAPVDRVTLYVYTLGPPKKKKIRLDFRTTNWQQPNPVPGESLLPTFTEKGRGSTAMLDEGLQTMVYSSNIGVLI